MCLYPSSRFYSKLFLQLSLLGKIFVNLTIWTLYYVFNYICVLLNICVCVCLGEHRMS